MSEDNTSVKNTTVSEKGKCLTNVIVELEEEEEIEEFEDTEDEDAEEED